MDMFKNTTVGMLIAFSATNAHVQVSIPYTIHKTIATKSKKNVTGLKSSVFLLWYAFTACGYKQKQEQAPAA